MSRVQLSINVSDFDAAVAFYSRLFGTAPGQAASRLRQLRHRRPAAQAGAERARQRPRRHDQPPRRRGRLDRGGRRVPGPGWPPRAWTPSPARHGLLLRPAGQGVGPRPRRAGLGVLHRPGTRRDAMTRCRRSRSARSLATGGEPAGAPPCPARAEWLRLARLARMLSWLTLGWLGVEAGVAIGAAVIAGSVALLGFGLDSGIEALAIGHRDLAVHRHPPGQPRGRAPRPAARGRQLLPARPLHRRRGDLGAGRR